MPEKLLYYDKTHNTIFDPGNFHGIKILLPDGTTDWTWSSSGYLWLELNGRLKQYKIPEDAIKTDVEGVYKLLG